MVLLNRDIVEPVDIPPGLMHARVTLTRTGDLKLIATLDLICSSFATAIVGVRYVLRWPPRGVQ
ncbi:MAG: hypothetical protein ACR2RL_07780 [Gammaproteobacteria bacterium]